MSRIDEVYELLKDSDRRHCLKSEVIRRDPLEVVTVGQYPDGSINFHYFLLKGKLHGPGKVWSPQGVLLIEENFHKGVLHGLVRRWHENGKPQLLAYYTNGSFDGLRREWYADGSPKSEAYYQMDKLQGDWAEWFPGSRLKERGSYVDGYPHGFFKEFHYQGGVKSRKIYLRGQECSGKIERLLKKDKLDVARIVRMDNASLRRLCLEEIGYERLLNELVHEVVDIQGEQELLRVPWHPDEEPLYLVKVKCPSTGVFYTLRVPPSVRTIHEAVVWTFGLSGFEYRPEEES